ncbi:MAG TPA: response regulator [Rhodocyclaceae bacterium]|nr:response regulator [Rhodocyclaceae bacterium]
MISTVLVVDDSKMSRKVNLALVRELLGNEVNYLDASGGAEALEMLQSTAIDLMLLDLTMPNVSGYDVLVAMRKLNLATQVIVISADIQPAAKERVMSLGAAGFIEKNIKPEVLRGMLVKLGVFHD